MSVKPNIRMTQDRVMVSIKEEKITKGGIIIPDTVKEKPTKGSVVAVGPGIYQNGILIPTTVKEGEEIIFNKFAGAEIEIDGHKYLVLRESDITAVLIS